MKLFLIIMLIVILIEMYKSVMILFFDDYREFLAFKFGKPLLILYSDERKKTVIDSYNKRIKFFGISTLFGGIVLSIGIILMLVDLYS